ncbi:Protein kinase-like domain protein [Beauveria brongniartii RCEF 3172]|uniref:Protein kinase-like domain protein n=1 Tax=Beauveria brongniartii RCEF 3172 TaxID=1081107 RepID=A0A162JLD8_9HYPO|nr:Protein kinase-like domain protein [Beauveria brongniartii RCEF 3172]
MSRPQTPPHEPRYNVHVAPRTIEKLIDSAFPGVEPLSHSELEANKGYNNRIYFVKVRRKGQCSIFRNTDATERELVLKVNGRFFLADKVQNEVGCLQIIGQYCPDIPTPTVFAWSEDGFNVSLSNPSGSEKKDVILSIPENERHHGGWILMSRLPGTPLSACDFDDAARLDIMRQLAGIAASWRTNIPAQRYLGNIQFHQPLHASESDFSIIHNSGPQPHHLVVRGILVDELRMATPISSVTQQHTLKLEKKLEQLESSQKYTQNRYLAPVIRRFITYTLPQLHTLTPPNERTSGKFVFTHYDLSPRNILVTGSPPQISGIVDFEFAGFFAPVEEFLNDAVGNEGDWPDTLYKEYLAKLEAKGIKTPAAGISELVWETARCLERVADNIAPWWLPGPYIGAALEEQFAKSAAELQENLKKLSSAVEKS